MHRPVFTTRTAPPAPSHPTAGSRQFGRSEQGFTLLELIVVVSILGILSTVVFPSLGSFSPKYRLRAAARMVGSQIGWTRSMAGGVGGEYALRYDLEEHTLWAVLPPAPDDDPDLDIEEREALEKLILPDHIVIKEIRYPDGSSEEGAGIASVFFDPYGNEGSHVVILENEDGAQISVKFSSLIGSIDYFPGEAEFEDYE